MNELYSAILVGRILSLCEQQGITVYQLACISGVSRSTLDDLINVRTISPRLVTFHKIAHAFHMTLAEFLDFEELNCYPISDKAEKNVEV